METQKHLQSLSPGEVLMKHCSELNLCVSFGIPILTQDSQVGGYSYTVTKWL